MAIRSPDVTSRIMRHIKGKDTKIELVLRKELWSRGFRYRKNVRGIPGTPDIVFKKQKIAIFCDSEFWHGCCWEEKKKTLNCNNNKYWIKKIQGNVDRDQVVNKLLLNDGWVILRFWGFEIRKKLDAVIDEIENVIVDKNGSSC